MSCDVVELELYLFKSLQSWNGIYNMFMRAYASSRVKKKSFYIEKLNSKTVHQYGVSTQCSTKVRETFRQITQKLWATKTWDLDN